MNRNKGEYAFDIDNIMKFVFDDTRQTNTEITETYITDEVTKEMTLNSRLIREVKNDNDSSCVTIKYDLIKMFINTLLDIEMSEPDSPITFGESTIINTLVNNGLIKKID